MPVRWVCSSPGVALADRSAAVGRSADLTGADVSDIIFTSGTTGTPKGAMLQHGASVRASETWIRVVGLEPTDRYLIVNPFFHTFGLKAGDRVPSCIGATMLP